MLNERFERVCAISTFVCSPAKTIATYKNLLLSEVRHMRKQAKIENRKLMQHNYRTYDYETFPNYMLVSLDSCVLPGDKFELFVCSSYLILIGKLANHSPIVITHELPDNAYFAKGVSATVVKEKIVIQFKKHVDVVGVDEDDGNPFRIPIKGF
uniref:uncharacterized protein LOC122602643 n=1 Tax=Erigeron canadensis TaxID=72917 RepID=UPI001CB8D10C|nr:uncharacterized protein LOC122602643 [Erigeron canadensis]